MNEFTRNDFVEGLSRFATMEEEYPADVSLEDNFNCSINTYVERKKLNPAKAQPESNIACPLDELGLIEVTEQNGNRDRIFRKTTPKSGTIHPYILLAVIVDQAKGRREIKIDELQHAACNIGKVFNLDIVSLTAELDHLARLGYQGTITYKLTNQQFILNIVNKIAQLYLQSYFHLDTYSFEDIFC